MKAHKLLNPIEQLAAKLTQFDIPAEIMREADEKQRVTDVKIKTGSLGGNKIDRPDTRAAIILEHVVRQKLKERIPIQVLAKAAGVKPAKLGELQKMLLNYLRPTETAVASTRSTRAAASAPGGSIATKSCIPNPFAPSQADTRQALPSSTKAAPKQAAPVRQSILPELSIRLASKVLDPHGCVQAAQRLLDNIYKHIHTSTSRTTFGQLHDLQRFEVAYEAAAFYYYARRQQQQSGDRTKMGKTKASRRDSDAGFDTLDIRDLEAASSDIVLAEVKDTLKKVEKWAKQFEKQVSNGSVATTTSTSASGGTKKKRPRESNSSATETQEDILGISLEGQTVEGVATPSSLREEKRLLSEQWRNNVLADAIQQAKQRLSLNFGDGDSDTINDDACLEDAANQVFAKFGLLESDDTELAL